MTNERNNPDSLEKNLESIEERIRTGRSTDDVHDTQLKGAADALRLIERVKSQQERDTVLGGETIIDADGTTCLREIPQQIGRFEIRERLGQGGFGVVFLAFDPNLKRDVAIKVPRPQAITTPELRERFLREGHAAAALAHPNIVPVFESGSVGPICYTASQFIPGESLAEYLNDHSIDAETSARVIQRLADAVAHAHQRGVLHRDIKPSNIMIESTDDDSSLADRVRLTDFGLAKSLDEDTRQTQTGAIVGTPAYMPPEQIDDHSLIGPASDVYSLGAVLYELLTGQPPFDGTIIETMDQVRHEAAVSPRQKNQHVPRDLAAICLKCLEKKPAARYAGGIELFDDLQRFLNHEPVHARHPSWIDRTTRWIRRNRVASLLIAVISISALSTALLLWRSENLRQTSELRGEQLAEKSQQLRSAIDRLFVAMADSPELDLAALDPFKQRLLQEVRDFRDQLTDESPDDQELLFDHWRTTQNLAALTWKLGDQETALEISKELLDDINLHIDRSGFDPVALSRLQINCLQLCVSNEVRSGSLDQFREYAKRSLAISEAAAEQDQSIAGSVLLAETLSSLAKSNEALGEYDRANELNNRAIAIWETIPDSAKTGSVAQKCASSWFAAAMTAANQNEMQQSIEYCDKAIDIVESSTDEAAELPTEPYLTLSESFRVKGYALGKIPDRMEEAISCSRRSWEIAKELSLRHPWQAYYQRLPAVSGYSLALQQFLSGDRETAEPIFRENAELLDRLIIRFPDDRNVLRGHLSNNLTMLGYCYKHKGNVTRQLELLNRSRDLVISQVEESDASPALQVALAGIDGERAWCMAKTGQNESALKMVNDAIQRLEDRLVNVTMDEQASRFLNGNREFRVDILIRNRLFDRAESELQSLITDQAGSNQIGRAKDRLKLEVFRGNDDEAITATQDFADVYFASEDSQAWLHAAHFAAELLTELDNRENESPECEAAIVQLGLSALTEIVSQTDDGEAKADLKLQLLEDTKLQRLRENDEFQSWYSE